MLDGGRIAIVTGAGRGIGRETASYVNGSVVVVDGGQTAMLPFPTSADFS